jgi:hypothetical protein
VRIHPHETAALFSQHEAREVFMWPRAARYRIVQGTIYADGERREEDDRPYDENGNPRDYRNYDRRSPLNDPQLFQSFARLASHNGPSETRILKWVHEHGLLRREHLELDGDAFMRDGDVNQAPMTVTDFRAEVYQLRGLADLYRQIREHRTEKIEHRISNPASPVDEALAHGFDKEAAFTFPNRLIDPRGVSYLQALVGKSLSRAPDVTLYHADMVLCRLVSEKLEGIRPRLTSGFALPEEVNSLTASEALELLKDKEKASKILAPPKTYRLQPSWSCSDLLAAIYLQFFLWVSGNRPVRVCENENCRMPFPATRKNRKFCSDSCASGARYHRKKAGR